MAKTQYEFVKKESVLLSGDARFCIDIYVNALNEGDYVKHKLVPGRETEYNEQGWSYGLPPRYSDGRVTTRRTPWVFAVKHNINNEWDDAVAIVYLAQDKNDPYRSPVGYLRKK